MNKFIALLVTLAVTLFAINSLADVPASPAPQSWISDTSHVLSADAHARLDAKLKGINQSSANEIAALIVPTLNGQDISDLANATFKAWGVGKKDLDNGVLVVIAMREHKTRIETGKGVEGDFPDLKTQDVLNQAKPYLRKGDVEGALGFIFDSSASTIANHKAEVAAQAARGVTTPTSVPTPVSTGPQTTSGGGSNVMCSTGAVGAGSGFPVFLILAGLVLVIALVVASNRRRQRREAEEAETRERLRKEMAQRLNLARAKREAEEALVKPTPVVAVPVVPSPAPVVQRPTVPRPTPRPVAPSLPPRAHAHSDHTGVHAHASGHGSAAAASGTGTAVAVGAGLATAVALAAEDETRRQNEARARREREEREEAEARREREAADRRRREQEEEDRRRRAREQEDEDRRRRDSESSSSSSSSSWDSGSSWGGGSDSGGSGGFGGGDSGGGGSSSDW